MLTLSEIDLQRREKLDSAWEIFSDLIIPGMNYREELARLRRGEKDETLQETEQRVKRLERREAGLRQQFIYSIPDGYFHVFGLNPDTDINSAVLKPINCNFLDSKLDGFEVDWHSNQIKASGRTFMALEFQPNIDGIRAAWFGTDLSTLKNLNVDAQETQLVDLKVRQDDRTTADPVRASTYRKPSGAKAQTEFRNHVIAECYRRHSDFGEWPFESRQSECIRLAKELKPSQDWSKRFFGRTSIYEATRKLQGTGQIPSDNVR